MENFDFKKYLKVNLLNESSLSKLDLSPLSEEEKEKLLEYLKSIIGVDYSSQRINSKQIKDFFKSISSKVYDNKLLSFDSIPCCNNLSVCSLLIFLLLDKLVNK